MNAAQSFKISALFNTSAFIPEGVRSKDYLLPTAGKQY
jgi:hypothetical protein